MNFEEFKKIILENVKKNFFNAEVETYPILKCNGVKLSALVVHMDGSNISPTIYLEYFYEELTNGTSLDHIIQEIISVFDENKKEPMLLNVSDFLDYEKAKTKVTYKLINYERNIELLEDVPHIRFLDLAIVFQYVVSMEQKQSATILIHNKHLKMWEKTTDDLFQIAGNNTKRIFGVKCASMQEVLGNIFGLEEEIEDVPDMYILTNEIGMSGASTMLYTDELKKISERLKCNLYILPSSVHEVILIPADKTINPTILKHMVYQVNRTQLITEEVLSDSVYFFSCEKNAIMLK